MQQWKRCNSAKAKTTQATEHTPPMEVPSPTRGDALMGAAALIPTHTTHNSTEPTLLHTATATFARHNQNHTSMATRV